MKNYDKLKSPTLAKTNRRFQKKKIFILLAVFVTAFLLSFNICRATTLYYQPIYDTIWDYSPSDPDEEWWAYINLDNAFQLNSIWIKILVDTQETITGACNFQVEVQNKLGKQCEVQDGGIDFNVPFAPLEQVVDQVFPIIGGGENQCSNFKIDDYFSLHFHLLCSADTPFFHFYGADALQWRPYIKLDYDKFTPNECVATTSTSTIITDLFLKDNDISTIKAVSGFSDNKNYTIYYFPFLLFIYIFIILIVCLSIIYIFKIIRKK